MEQVVRITRIFRFEMAHALPGHDGLCRHIHGHSYRLEVTVRGKPDKRPGHTADGMVMDFSELKTIVQQEVTGPLDHALMLKEGSAPAFVEDNSALLGRVVWVPWQPTSEYAGGFCQAHKRQAAGQGKPLLLEIAGDRDLHSGVA